MIDVFTNKYHVAINAYNYRESVQKAISSFKANNTADLNIDKEDNNKGKSTPVKNNSSNNLLNHCNSSGVCWSALGCIKL